MSTQDPLPFVKWIGGKSCLLPRLRAAVPAHFDRYIEPMVGGGALFFDLAARGLLHGKQVVLSDTHAWLMRTYELIRDAPDDLVELLRELAAEYHKAPDVFFYQVRAQWNAGRRNSARFIFLKQTAFNGLWRENRKGELNMPWGHYVDPRICAPERIAACSRALQDVQLCVGDYAHLVPEMRPGDVVYFDPPYHNTFSGYGGAAFGPDAHRALLAACGDLAARGVHVLYTHAQDPVVHDWLRAAWPGHAAESVAARRAVNRNGQGRGSADWLVTPAALLRSAP